VEFVITRVGGGWRGGEHPGSDSDLLNAKKKYKKKEKPGSDSDQRLSSKSRTEFSRFFVSESGCMIVCVLCECMYAHVCVYFCVHFGTLFSYVTAL
jgi:hypothetical protein